MKTTYYLIGLIFIISACEIQGVEKSTSTDIENVDSSIEADSLGNEKSENTDVKKEKTPEIASDTLKLDNGITITYFKHGNGTLLKKGDMIKIDYRSKLEDGKVFDGNHAVKKPWIPFLVGWNQQTEGWDLALEHLKPGDDVDIFLPAKYARGKKGIKGLVPPNANNIISLRVLDRFEPTIEGDGIQIWKYDEVKEPGDSIGFGDEVSINFWVSSESTPRYDNSYQRGEPLKLTMGDGNIVPGLYKALYFGREGDRLMIKIPSEEAYGKKGFVNLVKPNEALFYDVQIAHVEKKK